MPRSHGHTRPCIYAVCTQNCVGKTSESEEVIAAYPQRCTVTRATLVKQRRIVKPKYRLEDGYCVVEHPVKAVFPGEACKLLEKILSKHPVSTALLGPPGTGKSTFLDLVEKTAPANVIRFNPEDIVNKYVGETEKQFRKLLDECESAEPCLLLVDEADQLIEKRGESGEEGYTKIMDNLKRMLLRRLQEWYNKKRRIAILVTSNYDISRIETALLRAGRFGEPIYFPIPDAKSIRLLFSLYGRSVSEDEIVKLIKQGASFSNIVEYIRTGELKKFQPAPFVVLEYAPRKSLEKLKLSRTARVVVNEEFPLSVRVAAALSSAMYDKPVLVLKDVSKVQELYFLGKSMNMPVALTRPRIYDGVKELFYNYDNPVFFLGKDWDDLPYVRINLDTLARLLGEDDTYEVICGKKPPQVMKSLRQEIMECLSGVEH